MVFFFINIHPAACYHGRSQVETCGAKFNFDAPGDGLKRRSIRSITKGKKWGAFQLFKVVPWL